MPPLYYRAIPASLRDTPLCRAVRALKIDYADEGPWIAGGAALALAMGRGELGTTSDIDVFSAMAWRGGGPSMLFENGKHDGQEFDQQIGKTKAHLSTISRCQFVRSNYRITSTYELRFLDPPTDTDLIAETPKEIDCIFPIAETTTDVNIEVQVVEFELYRSLVDLLASFDFTVSMFATDGHTVCGPELAWDDLDARVLRVMKTNRRTLHRLPKYCLKGFTPLPGSLSMVFSSPRARHTFNDTTGAFSLDATY